jgi:DNA-directed RNA polymerase subunit D
MLSVKKTGEEDGVLSFRVKGVSSTFINAVRRAIMQDVPCLAIEDVSIYENDSVMFDEFLAHRLGLLPIKSSAKGYKVGEGVKMVLEKEGPCMVYSGDIKSTDPKVEVADKKIPLVKLGKNQRLKLEMTAVMQTGREHAKWQPAVVAFSQGKESDTFALTLEPSGGLDAREILGKAVGALEEKAKQFEREMKKIK